MSLSIASICSFCSDETVNEQEKEENEEKEEEQQVVDDEHDDENSTTEITRQVPNIRCVRICTELTALCPTKKNGSHIGSVSCVCETIYRAVHSERPILLCQAAKDSCYAICVNNSPSVPCLESKFDAKCYEMLSNECHGQDVPTKPDLPWNKCRDCLDAICNVSTTTNTQSANNSTSSITESTGPLDSKPAKVMPSTMSSNSMTSRKGKEPVTSISSGIVSNDHNDESTSFNEASSTRSSSSSSFKADVAVGSVIGVLVILLIAVVLIVIFYRRSKEHRVPISDRIRRVDDIVEATNGQQNPAYSLVHSIPTADHSSNQGMNIYSEPPSQKPPTHNDHETVLVDNDLYGHQPEQQNFPNETAVHRVNESAPIDDQQRGIRDPVYSLVQRTSTSDDSLQPIHSAPSSNVNHDTILVENDLYGCQQAQTSAYETAQRVDENQTVGINADASPSVYSLVQRVSTADDPIEPPPPATDTCSESTLQQKPPTDSSDRLLVDNDLYSC